MHPRARSALAGAGAAALLTAAWLSDPPQVPVRVSSVGALAAERARSEQPTLIHPAPGPGALLHDPAMTEPIEQPRVLHQPGVTIWNLTPEDDSQ